MNKEKKWYHKVSNWLVIVACIILIPILLMNLVIMYKANTNKDEVPSVFGYKPFIVLSGSMETEIHQGDLIITKITDPEKLKINDIIAFRDAEETVTTHRIIEIVERDGETYFITKGDNNNSQDQNLVELADVEGIYIGRIPGIGSMMSSLAEPTTIVIVVLGVTVIFAIGYMISNKKIKDQERLEFLEFKKMKEEQEKIALEQEDSKEKKSSTKKKTSTTTEKKSNSQKTTTQKKTSTTKKASTKKASDSTEKKVSTTKEKKTKSTSKNN